MKKSISKRDKVLLIVITVAAAIFAYFHFLYTPIIAQISEKEARYKTLKSELSLAAARESAMKSIMASEDMLLDNINGIISSYYPYIQPQYFVDLIHGFTEDLGLMVAGVAVQSPSIQDLSNVFPDQKTSDDPFLNALTELDKLSGAPLQGSEFPEGEKLATEPGAVIVNRMTFSVLGGDLEQYIRFLEKINNTGYPIYVSQYVLSNNSIDNSLELNTSITVIHLDRLTPLQHIKDASQFSFDKLPPADSADNFRYNAPLEEPVVKLAVAEDAG